MSLFKSVANVIGRHYIALQYTTCLPTKYNTDYDRSMKLHGCSWGVSLLRVLLVVVNVQMQTSWTNNHSNIISTLKKGHTKTQTYKSIIDYVHYVKSRCIKFAVACYCWILKLVCRKLVTWTSENASQIPSEITLCVTFALLANCTSTGTVRIACYIQHVQMDNHNMFFTYTHNLT